MLEMMMSNHVMGDSGHPFILSTCFCSSGYVLIMSSCSLPLLISFDRFSAGMCFNAIEKTRID